MNATVKPPPRKMTEAEYQAATPHERLTNARALQGTPPKPWRPNRFGKRG